MAPQHRRLAGLQQIGSHSGVDEHATVGFENPRHLLQSWHERLDLLQDVAAPDEVEERIGVGAALQRSMDDLDARLEADGCYRCARSFDVDGHRFDAYAYQVICLNQA